LPHIVEHTGRAGRTQPVAIAGATMTATMETENGHPGSARAFNAGEAVLDHETSRWRNPHLLGSEQEQVGRRLAMTYLNRGKNVRREASVQTDMIEAGADLLRRPARRDADGFYDASQRLGH